LAESDLITKKIRIRFFSGSELYQDFILVRPAKFWSRAYLFWSSTSWIWFNSGAGSLQNQVQ